MALSLASISSKSQVRAPRILLLGVEKIGKTSFACGCKFKDGLRVAQGINRPIVLPMRGEEGVDDLTVPSFPTLNTFPEVIEALNVLLNEAHDHRFTVTDSLSALEPLIWDHLCKLYNVDSIEKVADGYGKGYVAAAQEFRAYLDYLDALRANKNMGAILIGHVKVKRFDDPAGPSYDQYQIDVHDKIAHMAARWADLILFCNTKVAVQSEDKGFNKTKQRGIDASGGARFVYTQKRPAHPGGGRGVYGELPYELPLDWSEFMAAVSAALEIRSVTT